MDKELISFFVSVSEYSVLFPLFLAIIKFRVNPRYLKILGILVLCSFSSDMINHFYFMDINLVANIFTIIQFIFLCMIYLMLRPQPNYRRIIYYTITIFVLFSIINLLFIEGFNQRNTNLRTVSSITFIILSIYYFYRLLEEQPVDNILKYPMFWVNSAILIYFSGNLFLYVSNNFFTSEQIYQYYYPIHDLLNVVKNILYGIAFGVHLYNLKTR